MKFNNRVQNPNKTTNHEGAKAFKVNAKLELYSAVVASFLSDAFYEKDDKRLSRICKLVEILAEKDALFVAQLAVYARTSMNLRTTPLVLAVELAKYHKGDNLVRRTVRKVIQRADEITEILAYYQQTNPRTKTKKLSGLSKQLQLGIGDAFNRFNEYQFAKYNRANEVKLRDALFLTHPKAKDQAQQVLFDKIVSKTLDVPYTWETALSMAGQQEGLDKSEVWEELVKSGKMGYMALLRNLRNIANHQISQEVVDIIARRIADPEEVVRSRQFPFRFVAAYREIGELQSPHTEKMLEALETAVKHSAARISGFDQNTSVLVATDLSASMMTPLSQKSMISYQDVGLVLSLLLKSKCKEVRIGLFGETYKVIDEVSDNILEAVENLKSIYVGHATNGHLVIQNLIETGIIVDKIMIFSDLQFWLTNYSGNEDISTYWFQYKKIAPHAKLYMFDLAGYGTTPVETGPGNITYLSGWSDKIFDMLNAIEEGSDVISEIEQVEV